MARVHEGSDVDDALVAEVAAKLQQIDHRAGWARTCEIGELVLTRFYGGDPAVWRDRGRGKDHSLRRLAEQASCPLKKSALAEAVGVFVFARENPAVRALEHIAPGHVAKVLRCETAVAMRLLEEAHEQRLSVRALATRASEVCQTSRPELAGHAASAAIAALQRIESRLVVIAEQFKRPDVWLCLDEEQIQDLIGKIQELLGVIGVASRGISLETARKSEIRELLPSTSAALPR